MFICKFCGREGNTKSSNTAHETFCHSNPDRVVRKPTYGKKGKKGGNQFTKAKEEGKSIKVSEETRKKLSDAAKKQVWSEDKRKRHSESMKQAVKGHPDSYTKNNVCGRVKIIEYNGVKLKGKWEVMTAEWLDNNSINWINEPQGFTYIWNGTERMYYPDFYLPDHNIYIEVKGYKTERDEAKWRYFPEKLVIVDAKVINVLSELDIKHFLGL